MHSERPSRASKRDLRNWKPVEKSKPFKLQQWRDRLEYWVESWRPEKIRCHSDSSETPPGNSGGKNSQRNKMIIEYNTRHDWVCKVIHCELCRKFRFDHTQKWCMHNPEFVLENETHKLLWNFEIQTSLLISARRSDLVKVKEKKKKKEKR